MDCITVFSAFSGEFYDFPIKDIKHLEPEIIPLLTKPKNCKKCFSRGHTGRNTNNFAYKICSCVQKVLDLSKIKDIDEKIKSR